ncbi:hypothetical protein RDI58_013456 [Solanum bulbocastanum]|uniref:Uncharacterized protein n=1 Tax=Solanum bulbocastanum TaxID=147425 RepID=A0AAN8YF85_SOLBU
MNVAHQKSVEPKVNTRARDSRNISSSVVRDKNNMVEDKDDEDKECEKTTDVLEEDDDKEEEEEDDDDDDEYKGEEEEKERTGIFNKTTPHSEGNQLGLGFEIIFTEKRPDTAHHVLPLIGHATCQTVRLVKFCVSEVWHLWKHIN